MYLSRLIYFSHPTSLGDADIDTILSVSYANNTLRGITGALFFNGSWFVQVLEGGRSPISDVYARILRDSRHEAVRLIQFAPIPERSFPDWAMRYIGGGPAVDRAIRRFMVDGFDPTAISDGDAMNRLLLALSDATPAV